MTPVYGHCPACRGAGGAFYRYGWARCAGCDGIGRAFIAGAPAFGCSITLADRDPGEIVTLGNGDRGRILWHMPRKTKKVRPETTFIGMVREFDDAEDHTPIPYPSSVGVASVDVARVAADRESHAGERDVDLNDPVHRQLAGRLL